MFDGLSGKLQETFKKLRGHAYLTEANIKEVMREIRLALLDADVNYKIVKEFVDSVTKKCLGHDVLKSVTPGQQVIKLVNDHLVELMGSTEVVLSLKDTPSTIMLVGLHGSGKTTTAAKLAAHLKKQNKKPLLVAADIYRPAAIDQLEFLGKQIDVPVYLDRTQPSVEIIAKDAQALAKREGYDVVILDTAGRLQIDEDMVQELVRVSHTVRPTERLLVVDSALGQEAVSVSDHFHKALGLTGLILTKLDGDARGGAALSVRKVTGCPIKFVGVGEKIEDLEIFYPDRMASRILGMGDIVSLVEHASETIDAEEAARLEKKLKSNKFDLDDFLSQLRQMKKLGGMEKILKMLPGGQKALAGANANPKQFATLEAIICSMTKKERENPDIIEFSRKRRIAQGAGTVVEEINKLLKQFTMMKKVIQKPSMMNGIMSGMGMGSPAGGGAAGLSRGSNFTPAKKKRKKKKK